MATIIIAFNNFVSLSIFDTTTTRHTTETDCLVRKRKLNHTTKSQRIRE